MRRTLFFLFTAIVLVAVACSDNVGPASNATQVAVPALTPKFSLVPPPTQCLSVAESQKAVNSLLPQIFGPGQGRRGKAQGYSNNIEQARKLGNTQLELAYVDSLINFTLQNYFDGNLIEMMDLGYMYHVLQWLGPLGGWLFRRGMYRKYYE